MNMAMRALFYGLCVNVFCIMLVAILGVSPMLTTTDTKQLEEAWDADKIVGTYQWGGTGSIVGDLWAGLQFFWNKNVPFIEEVFKMADNAGCPPPVLNPIRTIWRFMWFIFVVERITGWRLLYD